MNALFPVRTRTLAACDAGRGRARAGGARFRRRPDGRLARRAGLGRHVCRVARGAARGAGEDSPGRCAPRRAHRSHGERRPGTPGLPLRRSGRQGQRRVPGPAGGRGGGPDKTGLRRCGGRRARPPASRGRTGPGPVRPGPAGSDAKRDPCLLRPAAGPGQPPAGAGATAGHRRAARPGQAVLRAGPDQRHRLGRRTGPL